MFNNVKVGIAPIGWTNDDMPQLGEELTFEQMISEAALEGCFTIPGDGCVDYPGVFAALRDAHYEGWFIFEAEQDPAKANPMKYALMARDYIRKTAGI